MPIYTTKGYVDTLVVQLNFVQLQLMGHMGMTMDAKILKCRI
jgi:hypothetical protein